MTETTVIRETTVKVDLVPWWLVLLEGLAALIIGIYLIISPVSTTIFLVQVLGWYWLISGILTIITIFMDRTNWIWRGLGGLLGILLGILVIGNPLWSAVLVPGTLIVVVGVLGVCFGFVSLILGLEGRMGGGYNGSNKHNLRTIVACLSHGWRHCSCISVRSPRNSRRHCHYLLGIKAA